MPSRLKQVDEVKNSRAAVLYLSNVGLSQWPAEIGECTSLKTVSVARNKLSRLSDSLGDYPAQLETFSAYDNSLKELPTCVSQLPLLWSANFANNKLQDLPAGFGVCPKLRNLDVSCNQLRQLKPNFFYLTTLRSLHLSDNLLETLPAEIGQLKGLRTLCVRDNALTTLPDSIGKLTELTELMLQGNKLVVLPPSLASCSALISPSGRLKLAFNPLQERIASHLREGGVPALFAFLPTKDYEAMYKAELQKLAAAIKKK